MTNTNEDKPVKRIAGELEEAPHLELNTTGEAVTLANWDTPPNRQWSYRHIQNVLPESIEISKGPGVVNDLKTGAPLDLSGVSVNYRERDMPFDEYLYEAHCNAYLVMQGDEIVYENNLRMAPNERHLVQSVSKTTICATVGALVSDESLDLTTTFDEYFPATKEGYRNVPLQDALDMRAPLQFREDFSDPDSEIYDFLMLSALSPDTGGQDEGLLPYLLNIGRDDESLASEYVHYCCPNSEMLGFVCESKMQQPFVELFQQRVYQHLGAEYDGLFATDKKGMPLCSGGLALTPRDLLRYGQLFANDGRSHGGHQVFSTSWTSECRDMQKGAKYFVSGYRYHNHMSTNGDALGHLGVGGQLLYTNARTGVVIVQLGALTMPSGTDHDSAKAAWDVAEQINRLLE